MSDISKKKKEIAKSFVSVLTRTNLDHTWMEKKSCSDLFSFLSRFFKMFRILVFVNYYFFSHNYTYCKIKSWIRM